jgi:hypothetical protein
MDDFTWIETKTEVYTCLAQRSNCFWLGRIIHPCHTTVVNDKTLLFLSTIFLINHVGTRETTLKSSSDWNKFIDTCYSLSCDNCEEYGWSVPNATKQKFKVWMENAKAREKLMTRLRI